jgi:hypothetical protein
MNSRAETSVLKPLNYGATDNDAVCRALKAAVEAA